MRLIDKLQHAIANNLDLNAFHIEGKDYSYTDFALHISKIRNAIQATIPQSEKLIGLVTNNDIETYASILALWFEGKAYIPINPAIPYSRNEQILEQTKSLYLLNSSDEFIEFKGSTTIATNNLLATAINLVPKDYTESEYAYILFTSGSTGTPKGVPISFSNLNGFMAELDRDPSYNLEATDRCLQMFELTFDFSVATYLTPLLYGASIYTLPKGSIKYFSVYKLLVTHKLTVLAMVPSVLDLLRPYFNEIVATQVKHSIFCGGKLHEDVIKEWQKCIPNATILNYYGPTECTVFSGYYAYDSDGKTKGKNGVISIGKPFANLDYLLIDENNTIIEENEKEGELCIAGNQVTDGYWQDNQKNEKSFFISKIDGENKRFYKSGDLCIRDSDGDYMYLDRIDFQIKIGGYRVELGEIEYAISKFIANKSIIASDFLTKNNTTEIGVVITGKQENTTVEIINYLKESLPSYMVPSTIIFVAELPLNLNGKIDRKQIQKILAT